MAHTRAVEFLAPTIEIGLLRPRKLTRRLQPDWHAASSLTQSDVGVHQHVQPLFRRDTREVADAQRLALRTAPRWGRRRVAIHADAKRYDGDAVVRNREVVRHECRAVVAHCDKTIDVLHLVTNQRK